MPKEIQYRWADSTVIEPLVNNWSAWAHLLSPVPASLHLLHYQLGALSSYLKDPQSHVEASRDPNLIGGPFVDIPVEKADEVSRFLADSERKLGANVKFARAITACHDWLVAEAKGQCLESYYERLPPELRGYVEMVYDYYHRPTVRFIEGLLYESAYYDTTLQSFRISCLERDSSRSFFMSTPRLLEEGQIDWKAPFKSALVDELFKLDTVPQPLDRIREILGTDRTEDGRLIGLLCQGPGLFSEPWPEETIRLRYFGHACVLIEWKGVSILTDPYIGVNPLDPGLSRFSLKDLPQNIDYALVTHNHQDHFALESLLRLRHRIGCLVVPKASGYLYGDVSLKLMAQRIGFKRVLEIDSLESISLPGGEIVGIPFLGEHGDLGHSKTAYLVRTGNQQMLFAADSDCLDGSIYDHVRRTQGDIETVFLGMECVGAPLSWTYGPFFPKKPASHFEETRRHHGSGSKAGLNILERVGAKRFYNYAMGLEPWIEFLLGLGLSEDAQQIRESDKLISEARSRGFLAAERLYGKRELYLEKVSPGRRATVAVEQDASPSPAPIDAGIGPDEKRKYWIDKLSGRGEPTGLPLDYGRSPQRSDRKERAGFVIQDDLYRSLTALTKRSQLLVYTTAVTSLAICLHGYTGQTSIVVGSPTRKSKDGSFGRPNAIPIAVDIASRLRVRDLLQVVRETLLEAYANQDCPFQRIVRDLKLDEIEGRCPLFNLAIGLKNMHDRLPDVGNDLTVTLSLLDDRLEAMIDFNASLFDRVTVDRFGRNIENIIRQVVSSNDEMICDLDLMTEEERRQVLIDWNDTKTDYPHDQGIHQWVESVARDIPDRIALACQDQHLTYAELNRRANQLAHYLRSTGIGAEKIVAISIERSPEMIIGILGVLKAGGAYLPISPESPRDRTSFMLEDSRSQVLLSQSKLLEHLPERGASVICLDSQWDLISIHGRETPPCETETRNLAYVIYTSGSTGLPKGVLVSHAGISNLALAMNLHFHIDGSSRFLQFASPSFDASVSEIFTSLVSGACLVLPRSADLLSGPALIDLLRQEQITTAILPPSLLSALEVATLPSMRTIVVAGEACGGQVVSDWGRSRRMINAYGPTEYTVCASMSEPLQEGVKPDIGRPMANTRIYLLDRRQQPVVIGASGELCLGGVGLARGYLNRADLTAERFIPDEYGEEGGARLYRTGDVGRYLSDGRIDYLGRLDDQVKIRGFRIEPGEIEAVLTQHPKIPGAAVVVREVLPGDKRLIAYLVARNGLSITEVRTFVREHLPDHMIPSGFVKLDQLPLTPNGKVDRRALPEYYQEESGAESASVSPGNPIEEMLAGIWADLLGYERISIHDSFLELGGHSLLATQLTSRVRQAFGVQLPIKSLFEFPTVAMMAGVIQTAMNAGCISELPQILPVGRNDALPLSFAQQRLWILYQVDPMTPLYNIPAAISFKGRLNIAAVEQALSEIVRRHDILRATFDSVGGRPVQTIAPPEKVGLSVVDLRSVPALERDPLVPRLADVEARRPFNLRRGPLLRAILLQLDEQEHALLFTMHHIVSDGWSLGVLINEVMAHYRDLSGGESSSQAELEIQYHDYACWQRELLQGNSLETQLSYWEHQLHGAPPALKLSIARKRSADQSFRGEGRSLALPADLTGEIKALSRREGVTLFMALLAAFKCLLLRYSGQDDLVVGSPTANRDRRELEGMIGFFVNLLPLRTDLSGNPSFRELLGRVRKTTLGAYAHQDAPFERIVSHLRAEREPGHAPLFQTVFVLQNAPMPEFELPGLSLRYLPIIKETTHLDLYFSIAETASGLAAGLKYRTDIFDGDAMGQFLNRYANLLKEVASQPDWRLLDVPLDGRKNDTSTRLSIVEQAYQDQQFIF